MNAENIAAGMDLRHGHNKFSTWTQDERKSLTKRMVKPANK